MMSNNQNPNKELAKRFKTLRIKNNLTQEELAEKLDCSTQTIYNLENAKRPISKRMAKLISSSEVFGILDVDYLLDENVQYKSVVEKLMFSWKKTTKENKRKMEIVITLAELNGYDVEFNEPKNNRIITYNSEPITDEEIYESISVLNEYVLLKKHGKVLYTLSILDVWNLGSNLSEIFMANVKLCNKTKTDYSEWRIENG